MVDLFALPIVPIHPIRISFHAVEACDADRIVRVAQLGRILRIANVIEMHSVNVVFIDDVERDIHHVAARLGDAGRNINVMIVQRHRFSVHAADEPLRMSEISGTR